jgi:selenide,water dikinase
VDDPNALVDAQTRDDAAVYRIDDDRALVVTLDFFTPIVDDPADFGRIAAANSLSDIYAMGARPLFALNLLSFPRTLLAEGIVEAIVAGGAEKAAEAGIPVLGGHSIDDPEPKYGMVVVGEVNPVSMLANDRPAREGCAASSPADKVGLFRWRESCAQRFPPLRPIRSGSTRELGGRHGCGS